MLSIYRDRTPPEQMRLQQDPVSRRGRRPAAAELRREEFDTPFRAYKCPGTTRWHLATRRVPS
jgi:hypothetical protein